MEGRKPNRKAKHNYSQPGLYFLTICSHGRQRVFGQVKNNKVHLSSVGLIVYEVWNDIPNHYQNVVLDTFIIMPDHIHGIIQITEWPPTVDCPKRDKKYGQTSIIIKMFKSVSVKRVKSELDNQYLKWQRSFHDRIIHNDRALRNIRRYIKMNPVKWRE